MLQTSLGANTYYARYGKIFILIVFGVAVFEI